MENLELKRCQLPAPVFWRDKRVLLTGHTGFKGSWLSLWLQDMGAKICGIALDPPTVPNLYTLAGTGQGIVDHRADICGLRPLADYAREFNPDIIFHLAAQPLVRVSYGDPVQTYATNVMGTVHLLESARICTNLRSVVIVSTDKVYRNDGRKSAYCETDVLGGFDPYSASKAAAELIARSYADSFFSQSDVGVATARAGNVIGGGDWSPDRLIPDAIKAWGKGKPIRLRNPDFVRPWQHVLEPLCGYLLLAQRLYEDKSFSGEWNFGPDPSAVMSVRELITLAQTAYGGGDVEFVNEKDVLPESRVLLLNSDKARQNLGYRPCWRMQEAVERAMEWYTKQEQGGNGRALCLRDLNDFINGQKNE